MRWQNARSSPPGDGCAAERGCCAALRASTRPLTGPGLWGCGREPGQQRPIRNQELGGGGGERQGYCSLGWAGLPSQDCLPAGFLFLLCIRFICVSPSHLCFPSHKSLLNSTRPALPLPKTLKAAGKPHHLRESSSSGKNSN